MSTPHGNLRALCFSLAASALLFADGCNSAAPPATDSSLAQAVQAQLSADNALAGLSIQTSVNGNVATLSGTVANDAQRTIAARDAASVPGLRQVINNIYIAAPSASVQAVAPPPPTISVPPAPKSTRVLPPVKTAPAARPARKPAPIERTQPTQQNDVQPPVAAATAPLPAVPPAPTFRSITIPSGSTLPVRITQTLDSGTTQPNASFSGVLASDLVIDGLVAAPAGSPVTGHVDAVQEAAHFKGSSLLTVSLSGLTRRGDRNIPISTEPYTVEGKGRGKNTAVKTGGGAAVGALLGGIFGGGKGAAIGAAAGGGVGAGSNAITRGEQVQIPSESVVRFRLAAPVTVRVRADNAASQRDPTLERRPENPQP